MDEKQRRMIIEAPILLLDISGFSRMNEENESQQKIITALYDILIKSLCYGLSIEDDLKDCCLIHGTGDGYYVVFKNGKDEINKAFECAKIIIQCVNEKESVFKSNHVRMALTIGDVTNMVKECKQIYSKNFTTANRLIDDGIFKQYTNLKGEQGMLTSLICCEKFFKKLNIEENEWHDHQAYGKGGVPYPSHIYVGQNCEPELIKKIFKDVWNKYLEEIVVKGASLESRRYKGKLLSTALVADKVHTSIFGLKDILEREDEKGENEEKIKEIFLAAQNHFFLTRRKNRDSFKEKIYSVMNKNYTSFKILLCNNKMHYAVKTWEDVVGKPYGDHLDHSVVVFREWLSEWGEVNQNNPVKADLLSIRMTTFVPTSITFLDPEDDKGILYLTAHVHQPKAEERPYFQLLKKFHEVPFNYYWRNFKEIFDNNSVKLSPF